MAGAKTSSWLTVSQGHGSQPHTAKAESDSGLHALGHDPSLRASDKEHSPANSLRPQVEGLAEPTWLLNCKLLSVCVCMHAWGRVFAALTESSPNF